jgi:hypothetical protein
MARSATPWWALKVHKQRTGLKSKLSLRSYLRNNVVQSSLYDKLIEGSAFVNYRRMEMGYEAVLALAFW